jgi:hypothetical protein
VSTTETAQAEEQAINRFLNATAKAERAAQKLASHPGDERALYREQYARSEAAHARLELARRLKMWAFNEGHDLCCDFGSECDLPQHKNPYIAAHFYAEQGVG